MKYAIAFSILLSSSLAFAEVKESAELKREPARATACPNLNQLQQEYSRLSTTSASDQNRGQEDVSLVLECLQSFADLPVSSNVATFEGAVVLAGTAVPFDLGNELAQSLSDLIATPKYEEAFHRALPKLEKCRAEILYSATYSQICTARSRNRYCANRPTDTAACNDKFFPAPKPSTK